MTASMIEVSGLTKDYGKGRGIFDVNLDIQQGEVYGYIGTNGSGKTTTIRSMMGFIHPDAGSVTIKDMDAWKAATELKHLISYIPGEIGFPRFPTGSAFLKYQAEFLKMKDFTYMNELIARLQLDPSANLRRMSKGMKQKTAIVAALMGNKEILILDEPTTGLDPLMRDAFLDILREEKAKGKTIFMSSHIFEEIEGVCNKAAMIHDGKIVDIIDIYQLRHQSRKTFHIYFNDRGEAIEFARNWNGCKALDERNALCRVEVDARDVSKLLYALKAHDIKALREEHITLEDRFRQIDKGGKADDFETTI